MPTCAAICTVRPAQADLSILRSVQALDGIRVIDMATVIAAPGAARYLADFGADVIKVEAPGGDGTRRLGWVDPIDGDSYMWKLVGRGKRAVVLDLKSPGVTTPSPVLGSSSPICLTRTGTSFCMT